MRREKFNYAFKHSFFVLLHIRENPILEYSLIIGFKAHQATCKQCLLFRRKRKNGIVVNVIKWLNSKPVAACKKSIFLLIINNKSPHAVKAVHTISTPLLICV